MECTRGGRADRRPCADDAGRQTHQRGVPHRGLDSTRQHHDAGAGRGNHACATRASIVAGRERAIAVTPSGFSVSRGGQEAGGGEVIAKARAGSTCAGRG